MTLVPEKLRTLATLFGISYCKTVPSLRDVSCQRKASNWGVAPLLGAAIEETVGDGDKAWILQGQGGDLWKPTVIRNRAVQFVAVWSQTNVA